jgi:UDP:flavonoid glycosyltransferase YjiC (YdhE family)
VKSVVCYVSGHGFGHAVRVIEVLRALRRRAEVRLSIRTPLPRWFFEVNLAGEFAYAPVRIDVGVVQADSITVDPGATLRSYAEISAAATPAVAAEIAALRSCGAALILADIPPLAFDVARRLDVPGVGLTNFSWDWIYADYAGDVPGYAPMIEEMRRSYGRATLLLRLPMHGDLSAFPCIRDIPLVARRAALAPAEARRRLCLPWRDRLVLLSFGGIGLSLQQASAAPRGVTFVACGNRGDEAVHPPGTLVLPHASLAAAGVRYEDLVGACDAVMTKPGYGIVAECIANATPVVYTARGRFAEYPVLVEAIRAHLPNAFLAGADVRAGRWEKALEAVFSQPRRSPEVDTGGAEEAAEMLLDLIP